MHAARGDLHTGLQYLVRSSNRLREVFDDRHWLVLEFMRAREQVEACSDNAGPRELSEVLSSRRSWYEITDQLHCVRRLVRRRSRR